MAHLVGRPLMMSPTSVVIRRAMRRVDEELDERVRVRELGAAAVVDGQHQQAEQHGAVQQSAWGSQAGGGEQSSHAGAWMAITLI